MILFDIDEHNKQISKASGCVYNNKDHTISRISTSGALLGGVVYKKYTGSSVEMHVAGFTPTWLSRDFLWCAFHYPFEQLGCRRVFALVPSDNLHALTFDTKLGFTPEAVIPDVYPHADLHILSMTRDQCRWLKLQPKALKDNVGGR